MCQQAYRPSEGKIQSIMKNFILKILLLFILIVAGQLLLYVAIYRVNPSFPEFDFLRQHLQENKEVIFFGDSAMAAADQNDKDKRSIAEFLQDQIAPFKVGRVDHGGYQLDLYLEFYKYIIRDGYQPKFVIIPINTRSFSPTWDMRPGYQFEWEKSILQKGRFGYCVLYRPLLVFSHSFKRITDKEFMATPVFNGLTQVGTVKDFEKIDYGSKTREVAMQKTIYDYMFSLSPSHRKLQSLLEIIKSRSPQTKLIFYVTPVNYEKGENYFPGIFKNRLAENVAVVKNSVQGTGAVFLDLSVALPEEIFVGGKEKPFLDEHLNEEGRRFVAQSLAEIIKINN